VKGLGDDGKIRQFGHGGDCSREKPCARLSRLRKQTAEDTSTPASHEGRGPRPTPHGPPSHRSGTGLGIARAVVVFGDID
jgi:hypothetical protein